MFPPDEIDTLSSLIDDLFELSRLEARELELDLAPLPVAEVINKTVRGLQKLAWEQHFGFFAYNTGSQCRLWRNSAACGATVPLLTCHKLTPTLTCDQKMLK